MKDDDFSNIVRSGTAHSVNVSEYTGNAKNPKNMVREGDANELGPKKRTPEEVDAALYLEKLQGSQDVGHIEKVTPPAGGARTAAPQKVAASGPAAANLQKADSEANAANVQQVNHDVVAKPNVQSVSSGQVTDTRASINADATPEPNRQGIGVDRLHDQTATTAKEAFNDRTAHGGATHLADNHQSVPGSATATDNRQGLGAEHLRDNHATVAKDPLAENTQNIEQEHFADHHHALPGSQAGADNRQGVDTEHLRDNTQNLEQDSLADNHQPLPEGDAVQTNRQGVDGEHQQDRQAGVAKDRLHDHAVSLDADPAHDQPRHTESAGQDDSHAPVSEGPATSHFHALSDDAAADDRDKLSASAHAQHDAPTLSERLSDNQQALPDQAISSNLQTVATSATKDNTQSVPQESFKDNTQAAPEAAPLPAQVPGVEKKALEDHHEPLPESHAPPSQADVATQEVHEGQPTPAGTVIARGPTQRVAIRPSKAGSAAQVTSPRRVVPSKAMDEFHGRLAGIKQTVEQLNHRLSDFEAQMEKDSDLPRGLDRD